MENQTVFLEERDYSLLSTKTRQELVEKSKTYLLVLRFLTSLSLIRRLSLSPDEHNTGWKFYFKLYCFLDTENVPKDSVEFAFMFEQVR